MAGALLETTGCLSLQVQVLYGLCCCDPYLCTKSCSPMLPSKISRAVRNLSKRSDGWQFAVDGWQLVFCPSMWASHSATLCKPLLFTCSVSLSSHPPYREEKLSNLTYLIALPLELSPYYTQL